MLQRNIRRVLASYVPPQALGQGTRQALEGLGYKIVPAATRGRFNDASWKPDLRLVDDRHLDRLPGREDRVPIIVLTGRRTGVIEDGSDLLRGEPGIDSDQNARHKWHCKVGDEHLRGVRAEVGDPVSF